MGERADEKQIGGDHYKRMPIQPTEFIYRNGIGWHEGNAIKYICRHKFKAGRKDLEKAIHYLELLLEIEYEGNNNEHKARRDDGPAKESALPLDPQRDLFDGPLRRDTFGPTHYEFRAANYCLRGELSGDLREGE